MCEILGVQMFENHRASAREFSEMDPYAVFFFGGGVRMLLLYCRPWRSKLSNSPCFVRAYVPNCQIIQA